MIFMFLTASQCGPLSCSVDSGMKVLDKKIKKCANIDWKWVRFQYVYFLDMQVLKKNLIESRLQFENELAVIVFMNSQACFSYYENYGKIK